MSGDLWFIHREGGTLLGFRYSATLNKVSSLDTLRLSLRLPPLFNKEMAMATGRKPLPKVGRLTKQQTTMGSTDGEESLCVLY